MCLLLCVCVCVCVCGMCCTITCESVNIRPWHIEHNSFTFLPEHKKAQYYTVNLIPRTYHGIQKLLQILIAFYWSLYNLDSIIITTGEHKMILRA